jgi:hypothetical protein
VFYRLLPPGEVPGGLGDLQGGTPCTLQLARKPECQSGSRAWREQAIDKGEAFPPDMVDHGMIGSGTGICARDAGIT